MADRLLKITYHGAGATKKLNAYLRMPSVNLFILRREIEMYLFQERQLPQSEIRTYWIGKLAKLYVYMYVNESCMKCMHQMAKSIECSVCACV